VSAWGRESEDKKLKEQWQRDFGYGVEDEAISLLYAACSLGDLETVKLFLRHGACVHAEPVRESLGVNDAPPRDVYDARVVPAALATRVLD